MNLVFQIFLISLMTTFSVAAQNTQIYKLDKSIQVFDLNTGKTTTLRPRDNLKFTILGSVGGSYRLEIMDSRGNIRKGEFISHKSNIDNGFVLTKVVEQFGDVVNALNNVDNCDYCDHVREMNTEQMMGSGPCDVPGTDGDWKRKCRELYSNKGIPKEALDYALKAMKLNATSFRSNKCFDARGLKESGHTSMAGLTESKLERDLLKNGLPNKCQMIINDVEARLSKCRASMFYIDLCSGENAIVRSDYHNLGEASCGTTTSYSNREGSNATLKGVFFTHNKTFDYADVVNDGSYEEVQNLVSRRGGPSQATAVSLFGLQRTNNYASKNQNYLHVSKEWSSKGSISVAPENFYMIEALAENGPSMVVNWARSGMEDIEACSR